MLHKYPHFNPNKYGLYAKSAVVKSGSTAIITSIIILFGSRSIGKPC